MEVARRVCERLGPYLLEHGSAQVVSDVNGVASCRGADQIPAELLKLCEKVLGPEQYQSALRMTASSMSVNSTMAGAGRMARVQHWWMYVQCRRGSPTVVAVNAKSLLNA